MMPLKGYFIWMGLVLCAVLYGASFALGTHEVRPNGVQDLPLEIQKIRAQQAKAKLLPAKIGGAS
ncbi:MAG: hypothetical protein RO009_00225 [Pseudorhodoplanes sp.]|nr:hypothetical protein [Pseudorhodoplanes sp.]